MLGLFFKKSLTLTFIILITSATFTSVKNIHLQLPVRVFDEKGMVLDLKKDDLQLFMNGKQIEIVDLIQQKRSFGTTSDLGRNFILSFQLNEFDIQIQKGISFFITDVLNSGDTLIVFSPLKAYRFDVTRNKQKMINMVEEVLIKDCREMNKRGVASRKNLEHKINGLKNVLSDGGSDDFAISSYITTNRFLNTFHREFMEFRNSFLLPNVSKYRQILKKSFIREGEKWWIHFQQRESFSILSKIIEVLKMVNRYISWFERERPPMAIAMKTRLNNLRKELLISDIFPYSQFQKILTGDNISYNVIFWGDLKKSESNISNSLLLGLESIFKKLSNESGGKKISAKDVERGIGEITKHVDHYYDLVFLYDGRVEKKNIQVKVKKGNPKIIFKQGFEKTEIKTLIQNLSKERVRVDDISMLKNKVKFSISSFRFNRSRGKKFSILKVRINLFDDMNNKVYRTERTLRVFKDNTSITVTLPRRFYGNYKLNILVFDLIANISVSADRDITLSPLSSLVNRL